MVGMAPDVFVPWTDKWRIYGWYDSPDQPTEKPTFDPPHDAPCLYCGEPLRPDDVRTHSHVAFEPEDRRRSYFYRTHRPCDEKADRQQRDGIFEVVLANIAHHGD